MLGNTVLSQRSISLAAIYYQTSRTLWGRPQRRTPPHPPSPTWGTEAAGGPTPGGLRRGRGCPRRCLHGAAQGGGAFDRAVPGVPARGARPLPVSVGGGRAAGPRPWRRAARSGPMAASSKWRWITARRWTNGCPSASGWRRCVRGAGGKRPVKMG